MLTLFAGMREAVFKFILSPEQATLIGMNRDVSNLSKVEYIYLVQIRICLLEPGATEITDFLPLGLHIRINNKACQLPPSAPNVRPGTEARRSPRPISISHGLKLNPSIANTIVVNWTPDGKNYVFGLNFVKKLSSEVLLERLIEKGARSSKETKDYIIKKLADVDPDLATTSYRFSLLCPLGKMRMKMPAKSVNCDHLQCFDASIYILMNEKKPTWLCPTCNKSCVYDDIQIENYFLEVVTNPNLSESSKEIEILADGTWRIYEEKKDTEMSPEVKEAPIDSVNIDDSDEETVELKKETKPESSKEPENLKSSFVDLTLSDDEEPHNEKEKQENEAQAADAAQSAAVVDLKPQFQVQPQQAVTSSEQGVVIEIDSPSPPVSPTPTTSAS
jgi:E3 SUMO-protein ligase PIAS1/E3 SUMO-protein ligase PIAS2/E3 SUMO-protein ligase PIAS3